MAPRLPPLTALRAFDAAARHMSFAKAAEELFVSPAALSYQIKSLEEHFGLPLFRRLNRAVELTAAGRALMPGVAEGFAQLHEAARAVARLRDQGVLTLTAGPGFTAKWMAPRFFAFATAHPEIELRFVASLRIMDFDRDGVDAAIRFGPEVDDGLFSEVLMRDWVTPVCTPELAAGLARPEDLAGRPLIHDESLAIFEPVADWAAWFRVAGVTDPPRGGPRFSQADHAIDAALAGAGVAIGRGSLAERELASGRLVAPFRLALAPPARYRFVCPAGQETTPRMATLREWLAHEAASLEVLSSGMDVRDVA